MINLYILCILYSLYTLYIILFIYFVYYTIYKDNGINLYKNKLNIINIMFYAYIILGIYYCCGIIYFSYKDYKYAKLNKTKIEILEFDNNELFDKLIE